MCREMWNSRWNVDTEMRLVDKYYNLHYTEMRLVDKYYNFHYQQDAVSNGSNHCAVQAENMIKTGVTLKLECWTNTRKKKVRHVAGRTGDNTHSYNKITIKKNIHSNRVVVLRIIITWLN